MEYQYENFNFGNSVLSIEMVITAIFIGAVFASFAAVYNKRILGSFVRALLKAEAYSAEKAMTVKETGININQFLLSALREGTALRRTVVCADSPAEEKAQNGGKSVNNSRRKKFTRIDFNTARFYIPEEGKYRAEIRYNKKGTGWLAFVVSMIIFAALAALVYFMLPELLTMLDNLITELKPAPNYI